MSEPIYSVESENRIIVDCDGVIAGKDHGGDYSRAPPLRHGIEQVNKLYDLGYVIVLYTARYGDREQGNMHMQYERGHREWTDWLEKHGVKYHHAFMGKPAGVLYIDDKAARVRGNNEDGWKEVWTEVGDLKGKDKYGNHYTENHILMRQLSYWDSFC
jgi:capsule biosynthesis phosphatase